MYLRLAIVGVVLLGLAASHYMAYRSGKEAVLEKLKDDRITVLRDGKEIDNEVLGADDSALCELLGGCGLPDEGDN